VPGVPKSATPDGHTANQEGATEMPKMTKRWRNAATPWDAPVIGIGGHA
jgi:hypothetical protein